jgi:phosphoglycolate phosphatase
MELHGVIFDLDGTLLDTLEDISDAANFVLRQHGFVEHAVERYRDFVGEGVQTLLWRILPEEHRNPENLQSCMETMKRAYLNHLNVKTTIYEGIPELLDELKRLGLKRAVLSNKPDDLTKQCVRHYFGKNMFEPVIGQKADLPRKPDPTAARMIAEEWKCEASRICFLGDTSTDMNTAASAGMRPIGVLWGFRARQELIQAGAIRCLSHPHDFLDFLRSGAFP